MGIQTDWAIALHGPDYMHDEERYGMKTMTDKRLVELVLDGGGPFTIWREEDSDGVCRGLLITTSICDNPDCDCRDIRLGCTAIDERFADVELKGDTLKYRFVPRGGESAPPLRHLSAKLDVDTARVDFDEHAPVESWDPELLAWLKEGMSEHHLARLRRRWRHVKGINKEEWRRKDWSWWEPGGMVSWLEVYPDDLNLLFDLDGTVYWADDMYCINPGCACKEVGLAFSKVGTDGVENVGAASITLPSCRFSSVMSEDVNEKQLRSLWSALRKLPGLCAQLKERMKRMKPIGQEIVRLSGGNHALPVMPQPKVGRNDPCPCGSGKKFKKCCLRGNS